MFYIEMGLLHAIFPFMKTKVSGILVLALKLHLNSIAASSNNFMMIVESQPLTHHHMLHCHWPYLAWATDLLVQRCPRKYKRDATILYFQVEAHFNRSKIDLHLIYIEVNPFQVKRLLAYLPVPILFSLVHQPLFFSVWVLSCMSNSSRNKGETTWGPGVFNSLVEGKHFGWWYHQYQFIYIFSVMQIKNSTGCGEAVIMAKQRGYSVRGGGR